MTFDLDERLFKGDPPAREGDQGEGRVDRHLVAEEPVGGFLDPPPIVALAHCGGGLQG